MPATSTPILVADFIGWFVESQKGEGPSGSEDLPNSRKVKFSNIGSEILQLCLWLRPSIMGSPISEITL
jgi:hypothetical protein